MSVHKGPWPSGTPCWIDLLVDDQDAAAAFYSGLFGWSFSEAQGFYVAALDGDAVAAIGPRPPVAPPQPVWTTYLATDNADQTAERIAAAGGTVVLPPGDVGAQGRLGVALDPGGAAFGFWQAGVHAGCERVNEPGTLAWNECMSSSYAVTRQFYVDVFGYTLTDLGQPGVFDYSTLDLEGRPAGGIGTLPADIPAGHPSYWSVYFDTADTDASVVQALELGGTVQEAPRDSPFGRLARLKSPTGENFSVIEASST